MERRIKKPTTLEVILSQRIDFGGEIMTRKQVYDTLLAERQSARCADYFAFHTPTFIDIHLLPIEI